MSEEEFIVKNGGEDTPVTMEALLGIDMTNVEEQYGGWDPIPKGVYHLKCVDTSMEVKGEKPPTPTINFMLEVVKCYDIQSDVKSPEDMVDFKHTETIWVKDVGEDIGKAKGIMTKAGYTEAGALKAMLDGFIGQEFVVEVKQTKDKNDPDRIYVNLQWRGAMSVEEYEESVAQAG